jgi:hypothetical protein
MNGNVDVIGELKLMTKLSPSMIGNDDTLNDNVQLNLLVLLAM